MGKDRLLRWCAAAVALLGSNAYSQPPGGGSATAGLNPAAMPRLRSVDERFQSYNVEMVEVTGGRFWKPYKDVSANGDVQTSGAHDSSTPVGMNPNLFRHRPPIDLSNTRLRKLAAALGPAYMRVSGTWANTTYFQDSAGPAPQTPPKGFSGVLTRQQWKGVVDFSHATGAQIMTSFATSPGTRNAAGVWTPAQAQELLAYTKSIGGHIAATEFMNEPTFAAMGGAPNGYDAAAYARDIAVFRPFIKKAEPDVIFLGPGSVGEGGLSASAPGGGMITTADMLKATGPVFDAFSYHVYAAVSKRCAGMGSSLQVSAADAMSREWFSRIDAVNTFYAGLRDRFEPGKPLWITETADAACGGNPWASTFLDTFRYVYQHGHLEQRGVQVIAHNTLASSDYGLLDENTFEPRPNYWVSLVWRKLMGTTVLDPGPSPSQNVYLFAHCLRGHPGGVAVIAMNTDRQAAHDIQIAAQADRYTLTAKQLEDTAVQLNGTTLQLGAGDNIPALAGIQTRAGNVSLAPASITFLAFGGAGNSSCR